MLDNAIWSGNAHLLLAKAIADYLDYPLWPVPVQTFADGEIAIQIPSSLKTGSLIIVQSLCPPVNHHLMELLMMLDVAHQAGCKHISVVMPYFAYAREDRSAKLVTDLLRTRPIDHIITLDLHHCALEHFFSRPLTHVTITTVLAEAIQKKRVVCTSSPLKPLIVSPDLGGSQRAQRLAESLKTDFIVLDKKTKKGCASVQQRFCILVDDIVDTGKTLYNATAFLKEQGASLVIAYATHAVLSNGALEKLLASDLDKLGISNSIPLSLSNQNFLNKNPHYAKKLEVFSIGALIAKAIMDHA